MFSSSGPITSQIRSVDQIQPVLDQAKVTQSRQKKLLVALGILGLAGTAGCIVGSVFLFPKALNKLASAGYGLGAAGLTAFSVAFLVGSVSMFVLSRFVNHEKERIKELQEDQSLDRRVKAQVLLQLHEKFSPSALYQDALKSILSDGLFSISDIQQMNLDGYLARLKASDDNETKARLFKDAAGSNVLKEHNPNLRRKILAELGPSITQITYAIDFDLIPSLSNLQQLSLNLADRPDLSNLHLPESVTHVTVTNPTENLHELLSRCPQVQKVTVHIPAESTQANTKSLIDNLKNLNREILFIIPAGTNYFAALSQNYPKGSGMEFFPAQMGGGFIQVRALPN